MKQCLQAMLWGGAGDLRFYHSDGSAVDTVIADATGGASAFVHVEIAMGDGTCIGELSPNGLQLYRCPVMPPGRVALYTTSAHAGSAALVNALVWARSEVERRLGYGWEDIADAALHALDAQAPYIGHANAYDCSDFVTRFLLQASVPLPDALASEPHTVTPNALALALGVG